MPAQAQPVATHAQIHTTAVALLQQGRFPGPCGHFIALANAGYAPTAAVAQCGSQHDTAPFGKDGDVLQNQPTAWAALNGQPR